MCSYRKSTLTSKPLCPILQEALGVFLRHVKRETFSFPNPHYLEYTVIHLRGYFQATFSKVDSVINTCELSHFSHVQLCGTLWTATHQAPPSTGSSRQEHWGGLPFPSPGDLPKPGIKSRSPALQVDSHMSELPGKPCGIL